MLTNEIEMLEMSRNFPANEIYTNDFVSEMVGSWSLQFNVPVSTIDILIDSTFQSSLCNINCGEWSIETLMDSIYNHVYGLLVDGEF
jgi:hypothetical protein